MTLRLDVLFDVSWQVEGSQIPEPAAIGMFGLATLGLVRSRRRKRSGR